MLRWREGAWDFVETVTLRPQTVYPFADRGGLAYEVDALAPDDVWAVGQAAGFGDGGATTVPLAVHWDGSSWTDVDVPRIANRHHQLSDVVAISHDDVWAVGDYRNEPGAFHAVTYHWDGSAWSHVDSPIEHMAGDSGLDDVVATGPNDVWAIGGVLGGAVILMHWDGSEWSLVPAPANSGASLAAVGPDDVWASGWNGFFHWDGTTWTEVPVSVPGASYVIRSGGMEIVGNCDIWCVGFWTEADGITSYTLAERLQPLFVIEATLDSVGVARCDTLVQHIAVTNNTDIVRRVRASFAARLPNGAVRHLVGPYPPGGVNVGAHTTVQGTLEFPVPCTAPLISVGFLSILLDHATGDTLDTDETRVTVTVGGTGAMALRPHGGEAAEVFIQALASSPAWRLSGWLVGSQTELRGVSPSGELAGTLDVRPNYPNPARSGTTISFVVPAGSSAGGAALTGAAGARARLRIYTMRGELVRTLLDGAVGAGLHSVTWDGRTDSGAAAPAGIYFYRLEMGEKVLSRKLTLAR